MRFHRGHIANSGPMVAGRMACCLAVGFCRILDVDVRKIEEVFHVEHFVLVWLYLQVYMYTPI